MDYNRLPSSSGGGGQSTGNTGQNNSSTMGSIPRRSLPPLQSAASTTERPGSSLSSHQPQHPPPPPQQQHHTLAAPAMTAQIPRSSSASSSLSGPIPRRMSIPPPPPPDLPPQPAAATVTTAATMKTKPARTSSASRSTSPRLPRSHSQPPPPPATTNTEPLVTIPSEDPFVIKIKTTVDVPLGSMSRSRASSRAPKRKQPMYEELRDTDSEGFLTDSDNNEGGAAARIRKKRPKVNKSVSPLDFGSTTGETEVSDMAMADASSHVVVGFEGDIESPPPGTLSALWYSRESFLHIFVMEKIVGWKMRPITKLEWLDENAIKLLDPTGAIVLSQRALTKREFWVDERCRMEVSRINPTQCPVVLDMAAAKEEALSKKNGTPPRFKLAPREDDKREEVLLVKWRGRSYYHCSWERAYDIQKFDSSNNTARNKIRRFYQSQEIALGKDWKRVIEEERATGAAIHSHGTTTDTTEETNVEEYFPPQCLEVERILACDENEMNPQVLAKQRALNYRAELEAVRRREEAEAIDQGEVTPKKVPKYISLVEDLMDIEKDDPPWDPEDNVRYVVKWKSLPYTEMTWEYWRDIKHDAVDEAEDFWYRQRPPEPEELQRLSSVPHPHIRDFRKIQTSKAFGNSKRERPMAKLDDGLDPPEDEEDKELNQGFKLRSYQLEGVNWLLFNWWNHRSCILADEMGLGKTIQSLCFLQELQSLPATQVRGPFLIVAPLSLIGQWQSEARSWAPDLNVVLYHGSADARDFLVQQEFYYTEQFVSKPVAVRLKKQHVTKFHILITTYEVAMKDIAVLSKVKWRALLVDEAHRLKSSKSKLFAELTTIPRDYCVLLTGTPLANATEELWALLHFSDPAAFASKEDFLQKFGQLTDANQVSDLHTILKPYLLRRVKEDVEKSLPPKEETILEVSLTPVQKTYYKAIYERNTSFLFKGAKPGNAPSLMNVMMELRKACCHPFLIRGAEERILHDATAQLQAKYEEEGNELQVVDHSKIFAEQLVKSSGKMVLIEKLLPKLFSNGHKVLIFSQMVRVLDLLEELLKIMKYRYERLDGSTSSSSRAAAVDRFNRKSAQRFVMLLSTRAGGLGLNLTAADIVIIFDSDWNPQNDLQAMARAHRIGQTKAVRVYRLLTAKTYEMHMFHSASMKLGLERAVLSQQREQGDGSDENNGTVKPKTKSEKEAQAKEIDELLKKGAYDVFRDEDDTEAQKFMERDIDQLLESSRKVTYGAEAAAGMGSGLGSFSKASFVADTGDGEKDIDLDDENFWEKAVGLSAPVETPEEVAAMIDDGIKRSRKQVQVFDPYASFAEAEQRKKDKIALKIKEEKEEKERARLEKRQKKIDEKERKQKERDELRKSLFEGKATASEVEEVESNAIVKGTKEGKSKKTKKTDRLRAIRRAANEAPVQERLKQAWEVPHRNRVTSAIIRFGFGRFCKLRNESSLTSLPIQDIEIFVRSYVYQLSLQLAVSLMTMLRSAKGAAIDFRPLLTVWMGRSDEEEIDWICQCITSGIKYQMDVENQRRSLRMPYILAEPAYVFELRSGFALRALRRVGILNRLNAIFSAVLDDILSELGDEALGKRGCAVKDLSTLDVDLKARHVTSEELALSLSSYIQMAGQRAPASWWNRTCDIGLLLGTFIHGFGNYDAMRNDEDLPFSTFIRNFSKCNESFSAAFFRFDAASRAARKVFDEALDSAKLKATKEAQAAVAAAVAAAPKKEQEALALRKGGAEADAVISSMTGEPQENSIVDIDDSHWVTLPRLHQSIIAAAQKLADFAPGSADAQAVSDIGVESQKSDDQDDNDDSVSPANTGAGYRLPMPDARVLDRRLFELIREIERNLVVDDARKVDEIIVIDGEGWSTIDDVRIAVDVRSEAISKVFGSDSLMEQAYENSGVGLSGTQCGALHRSLDDGTDYFVGAASAELSYVAYGNDSPRYLRGVGVPMNLTRFAISALVNSNAYVVEKLVTYESERRSTNNSADGKNEPTEITGGSPNPNSVPSEAVDDVKSSGDSAPNAPQHSLSTRFSESPKLRASISAAALHYSCPYSLPIGDTPTVNPELWQSLIEQTGSLDETPAAVMFDVGRFNSHAVSFANMEQGLDDDEVRDYVENFLLPHCLRLCVLGNGPTRSSRGSKGEVEISVGISLYPECTKDLQSPLPDPCLPLGMQSQEAVACASAILRRARLLRAAQYIVSGKIPLDALQEIFHSEGLSKSMDGLPIWWCPWIHDLALLIFVATRGIFALFREREEDLVFSRQSIVQHMYSNFVAEENVLPRSIVDQSPPEDVTTWIEHQAHDFPTPNVLERRLALVCAHATVDIDSEDRYVDIPMFDHGGCPRN